jgi:hypothetical protein
MERHFIAGRIFKQFGAKYNVPESEFDAAMIDLSIFCAENDYKNKLEKGSTGVMIEDRNLIRLLKI